MDPKKNFGFQIDAITEKCLTLKEKECESKGIHFNRSEFIRKAIQSAVMEVMINDTF